MYRTDKPMDPTYIPMVPECIPMDPGCVPVDPAELIFPEILLINPANSYH